MLTSNTEVASKHIFDPVPTAYSCAAPEEDPKQFHGVEKDIESVGEFIRRYVTQNGRWASPSS